MFKAEADLLSELCLDLICESCGEGGGGELVEWRGENGGGGELVEWRGENGGGGEL